MKVIIISHMFPSINHEIEGIFVYQQVEKLQEQGYDIKVISPCPWTPFPIKYFSNKWKNYSKIPKKAVWGGVEVFYPRFLVFPKALFFSTAGNRMYSCIRPLIKKINKYYKFDIIHSHVAIPDGWAGMKIAQDFNKPLIITIHGKDFQQTIYKNIRCREKIESAINESNKIIVVSNKLKKNATESLNIDHNKLLVIPNGINKNDISTKHKANLIRQYKNKRIILSVSHLIRIKGIDLNLKAIAMLKEKHNNLIYLIIGKGRKQNYLKSLAQTLGVNRIVHFLGQLPHHMVMEYMSCCDIFSLPSWKEGFGIVYLEAMAHGKPVIACQGQGINDVIKDRETGVLVKTKDLNSLVEAMEFLLNNSQKAIEIGEKAKKVVLENYTWDKNVQKTIEVYREACK